MLSSIRYFLGSVSAAGMLTGCVSALPTATTPSAQIKNALRLGHPQDRRIPGWIRALSTTIFSISASTRASRSTHIRRVNSRGSSAEFPSPWGLCADNGGHVFVPDGPGAKIREYEHGGSSPIAILKTPNESPWFCAVDPTTGNLAVTELSRRRATESPSIPTRKANPRCTRVESIFGLAATTTRATSSLTAPIPRTVDLSSWRYSIRVTQVLPCLI